MRVEREDITPRRDRQRLSGCSCEDENSSMRREPSAPGPELEKPSKERIAESSPDNPGAEKV